MSQQSSVLSVKPEGQTAFLDVPIIRGKSAYEHALSSGLDMSEEEFNNLLANIVIAENPIGSQIYKLRFVEEGSEPDSSTPDNIITIVLKK